MKTAARYRIPSRLSERTFVERLEKEHAVSKDPPVSGRETYLDTFDWRLFRKSLTLSHGRGALALRRLSTGETAKTAGAPAAPRFAGDLPGGEFRVRLASITGVRALLPLFEADRRVVPIRILDRREKTAARVEIEEVRLVRDGAAKTFSRHVLLRPVKGYDRHASSAARWIEACGCEREDSDLFVRLCEAAGRTPGDYSSKLDFALDPHMSAYDALNLIFRFLAGVIRRNEEGVRRDVDTEFLHDWRVATRRTRTALGQLKKVVPKDVSKRFRAEFAEFGEKTNRLRDLDVYLLSAGEYRALLPAGIRGDIEPFFDRVREERARELEEVLRWMASAAYEKPLAEWEDFLERPLSEADARAESRAPVVGPAGRTIRARYEDVAALGAEAASAPDDRKLHVLRIECKKLRYMLEFFSSLYKSAGVAKLVKQLKLLQDNLGRHQDISVQQAGLRAFAGSLPTAGDGAGRTAAAVGALVGALENEKQALRSDFGEVFGRFASRENVRLVRELFGGAGAARGKKRRGR